MNKNIDTIKLTRKIRDAIYNEIQNLDKQELLEYFNNDSELKNE